MQMYCIGPVILQKMEIHIQTFGTSLRIINGLLSIKFENQVQQIPIGKIKRLILNKAIHISTDVIFECLEQGVDILLNDRSGKPIGRLWNNRFGSISTIRKAQLDFASHISVPQWIGRNLKEKFQNQLDLLLCFLSLPDPHETLIKQVIARVGQLALRIDEVSVLEREESFGKMRAVEGQVSKLYFDCVNQHLPDRFRFNKRSKRPALDMTNSMLNYAYGALYSYIETALIKAGLDPFIGFFHRDEYNRPVLTYDIIEPFRPWADWVVFNLCTNEVYDESFFEISDGGFWMAGDGKRILVQHFVDYFEEVIDYENARFSRYTHIDKRCHQIADMILHAHNTVTNGATF